MSESWDEYAEGWDNNPDVIAYSEKSFSSLISVIDINNLRVLDFGCGTGLLTEKISPLAKEVVALDTSEKMIAILNSKKLPNIICLAEELAEVLVKENNLFANKFDLIVASSVCGFLPDYVKTLTVIKTILKSGGIFVQWDWLSNNNEGDFGLSKNEIESAYQQVGLTPRLIEESFSMQSPDGDMPVVIGVAVR